MTLEQKIRVRVLDLILNASMASMDWLKVTTGIMPYDEATIEAVDHCADAYNVLRIKPNPAHWEHLV